MRCRYETLHERKPNGASAGLNTCGTMLVRQWHAKNFAFALPHDGMNSRAYRGLTDIRTSSEFYQKAAYSQQTARHRWRRNHDSLPPIAPDHAPMLPGRSSARATASCQPRYFSARCAAGIAGSNRRSAVQVAANLAG